MLLRESGAGWVIVHNIVVDEVLTTQVVVNKPTSFISIFGIIFIMTVVIVILKSYSVLWSRCLAVVLL